MELKQAGQLDNWHVAPWKPGLHGQRPRLLHCVDSEPQRSQLHAGPQKQKHRFHTSVITIADEMTEYSILLSYPDFSPTTYK